MSFSVASALQVMAQQILPFSVRVANLRNASEREGLVAEEYGSSRLFHHVRIHRLQRRDDPPPVVPSLDEAASPPAQALRRVYVAASSANTAATNASGVSARRSSCPSHTPVASLSWEVLTIARPQAMASRVGMILHYSLLPARPYDVQLLDDLLEGFQGVVVADKGCIDAARHRPLPSP